MYPPQVESASTMAATTRPPRARLTAEQRQEWRARREERRQRQRVESVVRAAQMHVARVAWERANPEPKSSDACGPRTTRPAALVGCSGWFYWHWRDQFYPPGSATRDWFQHYARTFRTVEINASFYCWPKVSTVQGWRRQAGRTRFIFTVKAPELITHVKRFARTDELVKDFYHVAHLLGPRMGCFLFQLPPSFHYSPARLAMILRQLDPAYCSVVEFRHRSWWNERVYAAFRQKGIIFCSCSGPRLPDELVKTADEVYVRFHGTKQWYRHDYSAQELGVWARRIRECGASRVWAYFNNDRNCYAIKNALELIRQLGPTRRRAKPRATLADKACAAGPP